MHALKLYAVVQCIEMRIMKQKIMLPNSMQNSLDISALLNGLGMNCSPS